MRRSSPRECSTAKAFARTGRSSRRPSNAIRRSRARPRAASSRSAATARPPNLLAKSLEREWNSDLVALYAECRPADGGPQLEQAERWLAKHPDDATLLYALGALCERGQLWGKAQTYFEASLAVDDSWRTRVALGELFARLNRDFDANAQLAAALKLALEELERG